MFAAPQHAGVVEARAAAPRRDERHRACATSSDERYRARCLAIRQTVLSAKRHSTQSAIAHKASRQAEHHHARNVAARQARQRRRRNGYVDGSTA